MSKVCAWCNKDETGRVVCFHCGAYPATFDHPVPDDPERLVRICAPCSKGATQLADVTHTICPSCQSRALNER